MLKLLFSAFLLMAIGSVNGQSKIDAYSLGVEGILKVDHGEYKEGIKLLKEARNLAPAEYDYSFELAKAYMKSGQTKKAETYLFDLQYHEDVQADLYILLSECYTKLERLKKAPNPENKRAMDAVLYGIQKLPTDGALYLHLAQQNLELDRVVESLAVLETGITMAPNFAENYFWAAKLLFASGNHLWAWFYAELFFNMTDDLELKRSSAMIITGSSNKVLAANWGADPEKMDQDFGFVSTEKCKTDATDEFERQVNKRTCLVANWDYENFPTSPLFERMKVIQNKGWLEAYVWSIMQETEKEKFLDWLSANASHFEAYREWRYWNPLFLDKPVRRLGE